MSDNKKVLTARAWGVIYTNPFDYDDEEIRLSDRCALVDTHQMSNHVDTLVVYIPGLTHDQMESDILAGLDLLAKSREVCEIPKLPHDFTTELGYTYDIYECGDFAYYTNIGERPTFCPSCGRKVSIEESPND